MSRGWAIRLGSALFTRLDWFMPRTLPRQLLLTSALMGMWDVVLDETASSCEAAVLRIASLISREAPAPLLPVEQPIAGLTETIRRYESTWAPNSSELLLRSGHARVDGAARGLFPTIPPLFPIMTPTSRRPRLVRICPQRCRFKLSPIQVI
jgi:hypothetical protein